MIGALLQLGAVVLLGCGLVATFRTDRRRRRGEHGGNDRGAYEGGGDAGDCGGDGAGCD